MICWGEIRPWTTNELLNLKSFFFNLRDILFISYMFISLHLQSNLAFLFLLAAFQCPCCLQLNTFLNCPQLSFIHSKYKSSFVNISIKSSVVHLWFHLCYVFVASLCKNNIRIIWTARNYGDRNILVCLRSHCWSFDILV